MSVFSWTLFCIVSLVLFISNGAITTTVRVGLLLPSVTTRVTGPGLPCNATSWGAAKLAKDELKTKIDVEIISLDSECLEEIAVNESVNLRGKVDVIIGPVCEDSVRIVAMTATAMNIPILTWTPTEDSLHGPPKFGSLVSTLGTYDDLLQQLVLVLKHHRWKNIGIISCTNNIYDKFTNIATNLLPKDGINIKHVEKLTNFTKSSIQSALIATKQASKIIVLFVPEIFLEVILSNTPDLSMNKGDYIFIDIKFSPSINSSTALPHRGQTMSTLFQIGPFSLNSSIYSTFLGNVGGTVDEFSTYLYDAFMMVGKAWQSKGSQNLTESLKTNVLQGLTGSLIIQGNRKAKRMYHLEHFQGRKFEIVANISDSYVEVSTIDWVGGERPSDTPKCGFSGRECPEEGDHAGIIAGACLGAIAAILGVMGALVIYRKLRFEKELIEMLWKVDQSEIKLRKNRPANAMATNINTGPHPKKKLVRMETRGTLGFGSSCSLDRNLLYAPIGNYKGSVVAVKNLQRGSLRLSREVLRDLKTLRELHHDNLNQFVGASMEPQNSFILTRYCSKGSLQDILENDDIKLDWMFKMSFTLDLARGMEFLHKSPLKSHGNLKSSNCVIDSRWVLKITDFGAISTEIEEPAVESAENEFYNRLLWTAPELLRLQRRPAKGTQKGDVFSFGIILQEIFLRTAPYFFNDDVSTSKEIINRVRKNEDPPYRPFIPSDSNIPDKSMTLMSICWHENPESRPDFHNIRKRLVDLNKGKKTNIMDNMIQMLEAYSNNLEQLVTERTEELALEKQKTDRLLYTMLPPLVAEQLKRGESVRPECYDEVSIFFSDIVGFTTIANESEPLQVVDLLNDLYTTFDDIIARHDVYKVETIGDAYMCVSGLPRRNGKRHTGEIANMALDLLSAVTNFKIRHKPSTKLQLRVGLHTGGCAAGVVGTAMPRYCLFGDTVNMASRMESTGKALHIHISAAMNSALHDLQWGFMTLERGIIEVKGKGLQKTYWLIGKQEYGKPLPNTLKSLQQKWKTYAESGRPSSPTESHISDKDHSDSMYGRAFRKTSIAIRFLHSLSHENSPQASRSTSELSVQDLNVSCSSFKERLSPPSVETLDRQTNHDSGKETKSDESLESPDVTSSDYSPKERTRKFAFAIPKIEIS